MKNASRSEKITQELPIVSDAAWEDYHRELDNAVWYSELDDLRGVGETPWQDTSDVILTKSTQYRAVKSALNSANPRALAALMSIEVR